MASSSFSAPSPPEFNGENYPIWASKMRNYLRAFDLWDVVEANREPPILPVNPTIAQIKHHSEECAKRFKALFCIQNAVSDRIGIKIMNCETAKQAWDLLKEEFHGSDRTRKMQVLNLRREFESLRMKDTESVKEFSDKLLSIVNQIRMLGEELTNHRVVEKVLVSLPERFEAKISSLEDSKDLSQISLSELTNALQATEQRRAIRHEDTSESAFFAKKNDKLPATSHEGKKLSGVRKEKDKKGESSKGGGWKGKYPPCPHCKKKNHSENFCWFRPGVKCRACNQLGHVEKVCKNKAGQQRQHQQGQQAQVAEHQQQTEEQLFVASCYTARSSKEAWLIDSGCTNHMTYDVGSFKELDRSYVSKVKIGNGEYVDVKGKGVVAVETPSGTKFISDVLLVPEINQSLLSVGQMLERHYALHFEDMTCTIFDHSGCELMTIKMRDKSFPIEFKQTAMHAFSSVVDDSSLWHKRLGHFSYSSLKHMNSNDLVQDLPAIKDNVDVCEVCQYGKQSKLPFPAEASWRASEKLQLIHTDVCGPMSTTSLNNNKYFLLFIDDFTRMSWVFFLRQKSDVFAIFQKFKPMVENETGCQIKKLRSDNGTEYTTREFKSFSEQARIQHQ